MTLFSTFTWKMHFSSTNVSYPVKSTPVTTILGWMCSGLSKNWSGVSLSKKGRYNIAVQWVISEWKSKKYLIFHEKFFCFTYKTRYKKLKVPFSILLRRFLVENLSYYQKWPVHFDQQTVRKTWEHASKC